MGIGVSLILIAAGAIPTWAVTATVSGINIHTVGVILMIVGIVGLLIRRVLVQLGRRWRRRPQAHDHHRRRPTDPLITSRSRVEAAVGQLA